MAAILPPLHMLYLDDTYIDPKHVFPRQGSILKELHSMAVKVMTDTSAVPSLPGDRDASSRKRLFRWLEMANVEPSPPAQTPKVCWIVGSYTIGKERVWKTIADACGPGTKVYAENMKRHVLRCLGDDVIDGLLTDNPSKVCETCSASSCTKAQIHVVPMNVVNQQGIKEYMESFAHDFQAGS